MICGFRFSLHQLSFSQWRPLSWLLCLVISLAGTTATGATGTAEDAFHVGDISRQQLLGNYPEFARGYRTYSVGEMGFELPRDVTVMVFFGVWCHDSEREVPRLLRVLDALGVDESAVTLIALDTTKREPAGRALLHGVNFTPTLIFYIGGEEVGRIVERPESSLEQAIHGVLHAG